LSAVAHRAKAEATKQSIVTALAVDCFAEPVIGRACDPLACRHFDRIADRIVDRAARSARIRRPRRNAAHAVLRGRSDWNGRTHARLSKMTLTELARRYAVLNCRPRA
jgi:hypothetical protein